MNSTICRALVIVLLAVSAAWIITRQELSAARETVSLQRNEIERLSVEIAKQKPAQAAQQFEFNLQSGFHGENVQIDFDGNALFSGNPMTDELLGLVHLQKKLNATSQYSFPVIRVQVPAMDIDSVQSI